MRPLQPLATREGGARIVGWDTDVVAIGGGSVECATAYYPESEKNE